MTPTEKLAAERLAGRLTCFAGITPASGDGGSYLNEEARKLVVDAAAHIRASTDRALPLASKEEIARDNLLKEINLLAHTKGIDAWVRDRLQELHRAVRRMQDELALSPQSTSEPVASEVGIPTSEQYQSLTDAVPTSEPTITQPPQHGPFHHVTQNEKDLCGVCNPPKPGLVLKQTDWPLVAAQRGIDLAEAETKIELLEGAIRQARDLLMERKYGNEARSPGHNARLVLEAALSSGQPNQ